MYIFETCLQSSIGRLLDDRHIDSAPSLADVTGMSLVSKDNDGIL